VRLDSRDLVDAREVANLIGLTNPSGVSVYRRRYSDFPAPVVEKGRCILWLRSDIEEWQSLRRDTSVTHDG
jgi:predicted DNA-binding transcriptional regulator AlpA